MVAVFVRDDVRLREGATSRSESRLQLVEKAKVDIDGLVGWAIERSDRGTRKAAACLRLIGVQLSRRAVIAGDGRRPIRLHAVDDSNDPAILPLIGIGTGSALARKVSLLSADSESAAASSTTVQQQEDDGDDHSCDTAATNETTDGTDSRSACVFDLGWIESRARAEPHGRFVPVRAMGKPVLRPAAPHVDVDRNDGTRWRLTEVLRVLGFEDADRAVAFHAGLDDAAASVDTDPPKGRPIFFVVIDQERGSCVRAQIGEPAQRKCRLWFRIDGRIEHISRQREAARNDVGMPVRSDRCQAADPRVGDTRPHRRFIHKRHGMRRSEISDAPWGKRDAMATLVRAR